MMINHEDAEKRFQFLMVQLKLFGQHVIFLLVAIFNSSMVQLKL